jgi:hypothetical protein
MDVRTACRLVSRRQPLSERELAELLVRLAGRRGIDADTCRQIVETTHDGMLLKWPVIVGILAACEMPRILLDADYPLRPTEYVCDTSMVADVLMKIDRYDAMQRAYTGTWPGVQRFLCNTGIVYKNHMNSCFLHAMLAIMATLPIDMVDFLFHSSIATIPLTWNFCEDKNGRRVWYQTEPVLQARTGLANDVAALIATMRVEGMQCPEGTFGRVHEAACVRTKCAYGESGEALTLLEKDAAVDPVDRMFPCIFGLYAYESIPVHRDGSTCSQRNGILSPTIRVTLPHPRRAGDRHSIAELMTSINPPKSENDFPADCTHPDLFIGYKTEYRSSQRPGYPPAYPFVVIDPHYVGGVQTKHQRPANSSSKGKSPAIWVQQQPQARMDGPTYRLDRFIPIADAMLRLRSLLIYMGAHYYAIVEYDGVHWTTVNDIDPPGKPPDEWSFGQVQQYIDENHKHIHVAFVYSIHTVCDDQIVPIPNMNGKKVTMAPGRFDDVHTDRARNAVIGAWCKWFERCVHFSLEQHLRSKHQVLLVSIENEPGREIEHRFKYTDQIRATIHAVRDLVAKITENAYSLGDLWHGDERIHNLIQSNTDGSVKTAFDTIQTEYQLSQTPALKNIGVVEFTDELTIMLSIGMTLPRGMQPLVDDSVIPFELPLKYTSPTNTSMRMVSAVKDVTPTVYSQLIPPLVTHIPGVDNVWHEWVPPIFIRY